MKRFTIPLLTLTLLALALLGAATARWHALEARLGGRLEGPLVAAPSRVLTRPFTLRVGDDLERSGALAHLARAGFREIGLEVALEPGSYAVGAGALRLERRAFRHAAGSEPALEARVALDARGRVLGIADAAGHALEMLALPPLELDLFAAPGGIDREPVRLARVPDALIDAVLAVEDRRFFEHRGLDGRRVGAALLANLRAGRVVEGASTLTQQLAKNLFLSSERTFARKLDELLLALELERRFEKRELLTAYLDAVHLLQEGSLAVHGVARASQRLFGKPVAELDLARSALLVGMLRGPSVYDPRRRPEAARARRAQVLALLHETGAIDAAARAAAAAAPLGLVAPPPRLASADYFANLLRQPLEARYGAEHLARAGWRIHSTLDPRLQAHAEAALEAGLVALERRLPALRRPSAPLQAALVAIAPESGDILTLVGGRDARHAPWNRATRARRQPGSAFKPVVALAALGRDGRLLPSFTLASTLEDAPFEPPTRRGEPHWNPRNHDRVYRGSVTLRAALEQSLNAPIARLGAAVGSERVARTARALGIESRLRPVPSLALGTSEVTLLELTRAYATLAAGGRRPSLRAVRALHDGEGREVERFASAAARVFPEDEVWLVTSALRGVVDRGTGAALRRHGYRGPVAGKTGTTDDHRDAWFVGYTPELAVGVWVGFDDGRSLGVGGAEAALPVFADFLLRALGPEGGRLFEEPRGVERVEVVAVAGHRAGLRCDGRAEVFLRGSAPGWDERCERRLDFAERPGRWRFGRPPPRDGSGRWPWFLRIPRAR